MDALKFIIPIYSLLFIFFGLRNIKGFLLLTAIVTMPLRISYTLLGGSPHFGWSSGIMIKLSDISLILLFMYLVFIKKVNVFNVSSKIVFPIFFFIVASIISKLNSTAGMLTLFQVFLVSQVAFLYYFVLSNSIETEKELRSVVLFLTISLLLQGSLATLQFITGEPFDFLKTGDHVTKAIAFDMYEATSIGRVSGTVGKPNGFAAYLVPLLILNLSLLMGNKQVNKGRLIAVIFGSLGVVFSFSRGGLLSFGLSFFILLRLAIKKITIKTRSIIAGLVIAIIITFPITSELTKRLSGFSDNAAMSRIPLMKIALNMIYEHPIIGVGANTFRNVIHSYTNSPDLQGIYLHPVHNLYLLVFAETGVVGFLAFMWLMVSFFKEASPCINQEQNRYIYQLGLGIRYGILAAALHMMVDIYVSHLLLANLFVLASLLTGARKIISKNKAVPYLQSINNV